MRYLSKDMNKYEFIMGDSLVKSQVSTPVLDTANNSHDAAADLPYASNQKQEFLALKSRLEALLEEIQTLNRHPS